MPRSGPKAKAISAPRYNLYKHRLSPFLGSSEAFLRTAKGQDPEDEAIDDDVAIDDVRRRSWTREQKLGAIKYATSTFVPGKTGQDKLIANKAAAYNIGYTPKMLCTWIRDYDEINASAKGCRKSRLKVSAKELQMKEELYKLFLEKRLIKRKISFR